MHHSQSDPNGQACRLRRDRSSTEGLLCGGIPTDNVRAVLIDVDGEPKVTLYRHGFTAADYEHIFSVTKSVLSMLIA